MEPDAERPPPGEGRPSRRTEHALRRQAEGRPVGTAFNDVQRASQADIFVQPDGRYVVRGPRGREHIFTADGIHITTFSRSQSTHDSKMARGERLPITYAAFISFQEQCR